MQRALAAFIAFMMAGNAVGGTDALSAADIAQIKRICKSLLGVEVASKSAGEKEKQLTPYLRKGVSHKEDKIVVCSGACGGTIQLRGDAEIYYGFPNTPDGLPGAGHDRYDTFALHIHGKRIFAFGPGTEYYPYPYYEDEHRKR
jgi:hypothetical protein